MVERERERERRGRSSGKKVILVQSNLNREHGEQRGKDFEGSRERMRLLQQGGRAKKLIIKPYLFH